MFWFATIRDCSPRAASSCTMVPTSSCTAAKAASTDAVEKVTAAEAAPGPAAVTARSATVRVWPPCSGAMVNGLTVVPAATQVVPPSSAYS